jgi:hypothetical protein
MNFSGIYDYNCLNGQTGIAHQHTGHLGGTGAPVSSDASSDTCHNSIAPICLVRYAGGHQNQ